MSHVATAITLAQLHSSFGMQLKAMLFILKIASVFSDRLHVACNTSLNTRCLLAKQQPFARSASTAAEVVKRRQALAELEMVPCTFHPALDPHSLALVAAKVKAVIVHSFL